MLLLCLDIRLLGVDPFSTKDPKSINMSCCLSCRTLKTDDRCRSKALPGLSFCGKHVKMKDHRLWHVVNAVAPKITLISKIWKGYKIRNLLKLAGPGVLNRKICHNDEELVLLETKYGTHPLQYFAFEENELIWWFDIRSIVSCLNSSLIPLNPYTRQPLSMSTRQRLRTLYKYRMRNKLEVFHCVPVRSYNEALDSLRMKLCQVLHENGFEDIVIGHIASLSKRQETTMLYYMLMDMRALASERPKTSRLNIYVTMLKYAYSKMKGRGSVNLTVLLTVILHEMRNPYPFCFIVMSALYRV